MKLIARAGPGWPSISYAASLDCRDLMRYSELLSLPLYLKTLMTH